MRKDLCGQDITGLSFVWSGPASLRATCRNLTSIAYIGGGVQAILLRGHVGWYFYQRMVTVQPPVGWGQREGRRASE